MLLQTLKRLKALVPDQPNRPQYMSKGKEKRLTVAMKPAREFSLLENVFVSLS